MISYKIKKLKGVSNLREYKLIFFFIFFIYLFFFFFCYFKNNI